MLPYYQSEEAVMQQFQSQQSGLTQQDVEARRQQYGRNALEEPPKKTLLQRLAEQMQDPMILVLIAAAVISGVFGEIPDMMIILIVVALNAVLGIVQENKAEQAIEALQSMSSPHSLVRRQGRVEQVDSADLVPGDIVLFEAGTSVPADLRIIEAVSLKIEEAALTGESLPVEKRSQALPEQEKELTLGDRSNMAYMGTNVVYGHGEGVVIATGMKTQMGEIADILSSTDTEKTPLQQKLASLSKVLSIAVLAICAFIFIFSLIRDGSFSGEHILELLLTSVSLAVAAIPEGLVVVVTVLLSLGVTSMSKRNAIVRRLTAVETLGCTQVICTDKTGTLTQNRMTVVDHFGEEALLATALLHCNSVEQNSDGSYLGDPTEVALVVYADDVLGTAAKKREIVAEAPFDSERKMMSVVTEDPAGGYTQFSNGAPDEILLRCQEIWYQGREQALTDSLRQLILAENSRMASKALRVLGTAYRRYDSLPSDTSAEGLEQRMVFIGLSGMIDPIRLEVKDAIEQCRQAGIRPVMITGDHKETAVAIAKELGMFEEGHQALTGAELSELSDEEFERRIGDIPVYARVQPDHKVRIVNTWKKLGRVTAMTGDGVNDAPALKSADIGIGMGITGTDVTKNVADMVLADDNFASIVSAVEEGRRIYENIRKAIQFLLASNLSEVVSIFVATLAGVRLFNPIHILWINLITDTFPAMALGMERVEEDAMQRPPRNTEDSIFADGLGFEAIYQGLALSVLTLVSFFIGYKADHITGMTMAFLTLSLCEVFHAISMRSRHQSLFRMKRQNMYLIGAMLLSFILTMAVIYIPWLNTAFSLTPLDAGHFLTALLLSLLIIPIVEVGKWVKRSRSEEDTH